MFYPGTNTDVNTVLSADVTVDDFGIADVTICFALLKSGTWSGYSAKAFNTN